ncbi:sulfotransferase [Shewanella waksmanii]|uniref:sulfotransferase n=1 Tax=Shewanella waksmanii TaxID=213783 RepID=UPI003734EBBD
MNKNRVESFARNASLEQFLNELNSELWYTESQILEAEIEQRYPLIFIVGPHRSGSTLFMQWLASLGSIAYPTNLMSRFYGSPIIGSKIQKLLSEPSLNYRDELGDFCSRTDFRSANGKTQGLTSPNEFWYFWRRFLDFDNLVELDTEHLESEFDSVTFKRELYGVSNVLEKPFALKAMVMNYHIPFLAKLFDKALFIQLTREPLANIASAMEARKRQYGTYNDWYSFKFPEYELLKDMSNYEQVAGQIYYINKAVDNGLSAVCSTKKLQVSYEVFCQDPKTVYQQVHNKLAGLGCVLPKDYIGQSQFEISRKLVTDPSILLAYNRFWR